MSGDASFTPGPLFEVVGHGSLSLGSNGQGADILQRCPVAAGERPGRHSGFDTAHLGNYDGTDFFQWHGRGGDGYFHPHGALLRITDAGMDELETASLSAEPEYRRAYIARLRDNVAKARGQS